jgi:hypothetical protein
MSAFLTGRRSTSNISIVSMATKLPAGISSVKTDTIQVCFSKQRLLLFDIQLFCNNLLLLGIR